MAKTINRYADINKVNAGKAKEVAQAAALKEMKETLEKVSEADRLHKYFLAPYAEYSYTYEYLNDNGSIENKTTLGETLFPLLSLLSDDEKAYLSADMNIFSGRLEILFNNLTAGGIKAGTAADKETDAKVKLQKVFERLQRGSYKYNANLSDLWTTFILSFKKLGLKDNRTLCTKKAEKILDNVVFCLWSKLVEKGYTNGMPTKEVPAEVKEARTEADKKAEANKGGKGKTKEVPAEVK